MVHENIRDELCTTCGKAFGLKARLNLHIKTVHEGLRPHKCAHCDKSFGQQGDLKRHIIRLHQNVAK